MGSGDGGSYEDIRYFSYDERTTPNPPRLLRTYLMPDDFEKMEAEIAALYERIEFILVDQVPPKTLVTVMDLIVAYGQKMNSIGQSECM
jgi:hypothetical protein